MIVQMPQTTEMQNITSFIFHNKVITILARIHQTQR